MKAIFAGVFVSLLVAGGGWYVSGLAADGLLAEGHSKDMHLMVWLGGSAFFGAVGGRLGCQVWELIHDK